MDVISIEEKKDSISKYFGGMIALPQGIIVTYRDKAETKNLNITISKKKISKVMQEISKFKKLK
jgi:hypothetical protein